MRNGAVWVLVVALTVAAGCATPTRPTEKPITSVKQVVGSWDGWNACHGCSIRFRASLSIRDDGYWTMVVERNPSYHGKVGIVNGVLQWGVDGRWYGLVKVVEEDGREWLTLYRANGEVWTEFDRAK
jgi:hypothetical protein